jgi:hypothetical protein
MHRAVSLWRRPSLAGGAGDLGEKATAVAAAVALAIAFGPLMMSLPDEGAAPGTGRTGPDAAVASGETIVAGYGGVTYTHPSDVHITKAGSTDLKLHAVEWIGRPFKSPIYYGLRGIRWPEASRIGGMIDFTHAKAISVREQRVRFSGTRNGQPADATRVMGDTFRHLEFSHGHNMLTLNGLLRLGGLTSTIRPYVGAGLGVSLPHTEVQFHDEAKRTYEYQMTGGVGQVLAGVELRLPRVSVFVEWKLSLAPYFVPLSGRDGSKGNAFIDYWNQLREWLSGAEPQNGRLRTNLLSHHLIGGVGYRHAATAAPTP